MAAVDPFAEELRRRDTAGEDDNAARATERPSQPANAASAGDPFAAELSRRQRSERTAGGEQNAGFFDDAGQQIATGAKSLAGGALDVLGMPADLVNIPLRAAGLPTFESGADDLRAMASDYGIAFERDEEPDTVAARANRIAGGALVPLAGPFARAGGMARQGTTMVRGATSSRAAAEGARMAPAQMAPGALSSRLAAEGSRRVNLVDDTARAVAARPGATATAEGVAVTGATAGGEAAQAVFPGNEVAEAIGELAGGLTPAAAVSSPSTLLARKAYQSGKATLVPFTRAGAMPRAARRMQDAAADADLAAERAGASDTLEDTPLSPARRSGDKRLLGIERSVADADPALDAELEGQLSRSTEAARRAGTDFGGGTARARELLEDGREQLLAEVDRRAAQAAERAQQAVDALDPGASQREISAAARSRIEDALGEAQATESQLWNALDQNAPASLDRTRATIDEELAGRSRFDDPDDVPAWLTQALQSDGGQILDSRGNPLPRNGAEISFGDVHALRKRVGAAIGEERSKPAPNRNKLRVLGSVYESLLDDMGSAEGQGEALQSALAYSRQLNQRFRQGAVGRLLGYERRGGLAVDPADTLRKIVSGQASGTQVRELLEAAPGARDEVTKYLRSAFLAQTMDDGLFNQRAGRTFLKKYDEVLERFPELRDELSNTREMNRVAGRIAKRAEKTRQLAYNGRKSRAALYLDGDLGEEWARVLKAEDPAAVADSLRRKVGGDRRAVQGLKSSFVEELMRRSETGQYDTAGQAFVSGNRLQRLLQDNDGVARALGMDDGERLRLKKVANTLARIEAKPAGGEEVMTDRPAAFLDLMARWIGAQSGQRIASNGTGSSLVMAQAFSQRMRNLLGSLTRDKARELVSASIEDPKLFQALLTAPTANAKTQRAAAQRIGAWLGAPASGLSRDEDGESERGNPGKTPKERELYRRQRKRRQPSQSAP